MTTDHHRTAGSDQGAWWRDYDLARALQCCSQAATAHACSSADASARADRVPHGRFRDWMPPRRAVRLLLARRWWALVGLMTLVPRLQFMCIRACKAMQARELQLSTSVSPASTASAACAASARIFASRGIQPRGRPRCSRVGGAAGRHACRDGGGVRGQTAPRRAREAPELLSGGLC